MGAAVQKSYNLEETSLSVALLMPAFHVRQLPDPSALQFRDRSRETLRASELVRTLARDAK